MISLEITRWINVFTYSIGVFKPYYCTERRKSSKKCDSLVKAGIVHMPAYDT